VPPSRGALALDVVSVIATNDYEQAWTRRLSFVADDFP
jgi:hypothetical protein